MLADRPRPVRVGLSGWNYAHWRNGVFYPPRLPASRWLDFYADYSESELRERAQRLRGWSRTHEVFAYVNNDWDGFAPRNAARLKELLPDEPRRA